MREDRAVVGRPRDTTSTSGLGDIELRITKQLAEERPGGTGWLASLLLRLPTGDFQLGSASPGGGFLAIEGGITAVKRQDPLVFFSTGSYTYVHDRRHDGVDIVPGDSIGLKLGAILAASPQTAIRGAFEMRRSGRTHVNGAEVAGSDLVVASLQFGLGMLLTRRSLLDLQLSIGVTPDAPDFAITAAVPVRF